MQQYGNCKLDIVILLRPSPTFTSTLSIRVADRHWFDKQQHFFAAFFFFCLFFNINWKAQFLQITLFSFFATMNDYHYYCDSLAGWRHWTRRVLVLKLIFLWLFNEISIHFFFRCTFCCCVFLRVVSVSLAVSQIYIISCVIIETCGARNSPLQKRALWRWEIRLNELIKGATSRDWIQMH